jgi:hypothetical protein
MVTPTITAALAWERLRSVTAANRTTRANPEVSALNIYNAFLVGSRFPGLYNLENNEATLER